jgi:hypothetical protein
MGGPQQQASGAVVSFSPKYPEEPSSLTVTYRNEAESKGVVPPCLGGPNEPQAVKGNLCVYRGEQAGGEAEDKNITEPTASAQAFGVPKGAFIANKGACNQEGHECQVGFAIIFRTAQFASPSTVTTAASYLNASGSWAVTAN